MKLIRLLLIMVLLSLCIPMPVLAKIADVAPSFPTNSLSAIGSYLYTKVLHFDTTSTGANVTTTQASFPICVQINSSSWSSATERENFFGIWNVGGKRVQFYDSSNNSLSYEVEQYDAPNATAIYWVNTGATGVSGNSSSGYITVGFGNDPNGTNQDNQTGTWDANFKLVNHMRVPVWDKRGVVIDPDGSGWGVAVEPNLLYESGTFKVWYRQYNSGTGDTKISYRTSNDGITWSSSTDVLNNTNDLWCPFVFRSSYDNNYYLYVHDGWPNIDRYISADGLDWSLDQADVLQVGAADQWDQTALGNLFVWQEGASDWRAIYEAYGNVAHPNWSLGYATSSDGKTWTKSGSNPVLTGTGCRSGPEVHKVGSTYYMWYQASATGSQPTDICRASSTNLTTWSEYGGAYYPVFYRTEAYEGWGNDRTSNGAQVADPSIIEVNGQTYCIYDAIPSQNSTNQALALAITLPIAQLVSTSEMRQGDSTSNAYQMFLNAGQITGQVDGGFQGVASLLTSDASSGQKNVIVASTTGFVVGQTVGLGDGNSSESATIASINTGTSTLTMVNNLTHSFEVVFGAVCGATSAQSSNPFSPSMDFDTSGLTLEAWFKTSVAGLAGGLEQSLIHRQDDNNSHNPLIDIGVTPGVSKLHMYVRGQTNPASLVDLTGTTGSLASGTWYYAVGVFDDPNDTAYIYLDGVQDGTQGSKTTTTVSFGSAPLNIGRVIQNWILTNTAFSMGQIDEVRISATPRSADWVKLTYYSMKKTTWNGDGWLSWSDAIAYTSTVYSPSGQSGYWVNPTYAYSSDNSYAYRAPTTIQNQSPTVNTNGTNPWTNPTYAYSSNNQSATAVTPTLVYTNAPTTNGTSAWTNPTNAYADGGGAATITSGAPSGNVTYGAYGFSLGSYTISQVRVRVDAWTTAGVSTNQSRQATSDDANTGDFTSTNATNYAAIADKSDLTYITGVKNTGGYATFGYTAFSIPTGSTISSVIITERYRSNTTGTAATAGTVLKVGGTYYGLGGTLNAYTDNGTSSVPASTSAIAERSAVWANNPKAGSAWTVAQVNGTDATNPLQFWGVGGSDFNPDVNFYSCNATVEYLTAANENIEVSVTWNGGGNWSSKHSQATTGSETTYYIDVTADTSWTPTTLNDANFKVAVDAVTVGDAGTMNLDYIPVEVTISMPVWDQIYGTFGITGTNTIDTVEIGYEAWADTAGQKLNLYTSANGGSSWSSAHLTSALGTSDPQTETFINVTADQTWTWTLLNDTNFKIKLASQWISGTPTWSVDWLSVRVTSHDTTNLNQVYKTYGISLAGNNITSVQVGIEAYAVSSEKVALEVSKDNGATWSSNQTSSALGGSDPQTTTWFDFTSAYSWNSTLLEDANFQVRITWVTNGSYGQVNLDWIPVRIIYVAAGAAPNISNTPSSLDFGFVAPGATYYAKGTAPNNPVQAGDCTFTVTNNGGSSVNLAMRITDFTGGNTWNIVAGVPSGDEIKVTAYYVGQDPSSGLVLSNSDQSFYTGLAGSGTLKWDLSILTGGTGSGVTGTFSDNETKTATLTISAS